MNMPIHFESSAYLRSHWERINKFAFAGSLPPIADIGWQVCSDDPDCADLYGGYSPRANAIGITSELKRAEAVEGNLKRMRFLPTDKRPNLDDIPTEDLDLISAVMGLVAHEMAHQAAHHFEKDAASHGEAFVRQATIISIALELPEVTLQNASYWPNVLPLIQRERLRGTGI